MTEDPRLVDYVCPCGKGHGVGCLQLSAEDRKNAMKLAVTAGPPTGQTVSLAMTASDIASAMRGVEPTTEAICGKCGAKMHLLAYLVEFACKHGVKLPPCDRCQPAKQPVQQEIKRDRFTEED